MGEYEGVSPSYKDSSWAGIAVGARRQGIKFVTLQNWELMPPSSPNSTKKKSAQFVRFILMGVWGFYPHIKNHDQREFQLLQSLTG